MNYISFYSSDLFLLNKGKNIEHKIV